MIEILDDTTKYPLQLIGRAAGVCYGSDITSEKKNIKRGKSCISDGHGRVEEWPQVDVIITGYSAKCIRELYTHTVGASKLQASTRYIDYEKSFDFIIPQTVKTEEQLAEWNEAMQDIRKHMTKLKELGVAKEDYTNILPLAYETKMVWKVNLRCLVNFMNLRLCSRAYWEIRKLAKELKDTLSNYSDEWKYICDLLFVPKCEVTNYCTEHECCGRKMKKEKFLEKINL